MPELLEELDQCHYIQGVSGEVAVLRKPLLLRPPDNFICFSQPALIGPVDFNRSALQELQGVSEKF